MPAISSSVAVFQGLGSTASQTAWMAAATQDVADLAPSEMVHFPHTRSITTHSTPTKTITD